MDRIRNPFSPGAGSPPPELVGRDGILEEADVLFGRALARRPERSLLLTGLRGVGKTVLLNTIERRAAEAGFRTLQVDAHEKKPLPVLLAPPLRRLLFDLDRVAGAGNLARRGLGVLKSFMGAIKISYADFEAGLDIEPDRAPQTVETLRRICRAFSPRLPRRHRKRGWGWRYLSMRCNTSRPRN